MNPKNCDRREFLKKSLLGFGAAASVPLFLARTTRAIALATPEPVSFADRPDRILVVVQLSGGNDGLNTVIPFGEKVYHDVRRQLQHKDTEVLKLNEQVGLHPNMKGMKALFDEGRLAIVQGVSYPNPNRSHFESMDIWQAASPRGRSENYGWIGRLVDKRFPDDHEPELVVAIGKGVPFALQGKEHKPVAFDDPASYRWVGKPAEAPAFDDLNKMGQGDGGSELDFLRRVATDAGVSSERVRKAAAAYKPAVEYPRARGLGADLRTVASLIASGLGTRIHYVQMGGFDTHVQERQRHDQLMTELSEGLSAFMADLKAQKLDRNVLLMTFSEFGRRVQENGSGGTDHGVAAPMFVMGAPVKGGLYNEHPSLTDLLNGDLKMRVDFRSLYATVIEDWLKQPSADVLGQAFPKVQGLVRAV